ncbi:hypothetical protein HYX01_01855 [Candidatus Woesearchaeota archaeon]|nr:hypothetical protein [Candidatus Woesearchaeota archaeon]
MVYLSIALFFVYTFCLGFTVTSFVKNSDNLLERNLMRIGFGLALLPFLGLILNLLRIPIDWKIILALSLLYPAYCLIRYRPKPSFQIKITKTTVSILAMLVLFGINFYIYASGAFAYPYLEDDDSWSHALSAKYVSVEKTLFVKASKIFHYIDPYPPTYDLLLGLLHQTNDSIYFTLKFFNALIVALSTIFFYFFVKELTQSRNKALFSAFALLSVPAFMSHFIWAISLTVPLYFVVFYALEKIKEDKKWFIVAALSMVTVLTSSPTHSTYFGLFFLLYLITKIFLERKLLVFIAASGFLGLLLSLIFWWLPMILKHGIIGTLKGIGFSIGILQSEGLGPALRGTGDRIYTFNDFFIAKMQNAINNPIGIGIVLSILVIAALISVFLRYKELLKEENHWLILAIVWLAFTIYAVNGARFTFKISPFRAWMLLAIPVCILAAEGAFFLMSISKNSAGDIGKYGMLLILLIGIFFTSTQQKIAVNKAVWPQGGFWLSPSEEIGAYTWMRYNLEKNSNVFTFANNGPVIGMDMYTCHWCPDVQEYMKNGFNESSKEMSQWLKKKNYQYLIIDGQTAKKFGINESNEKLQDIVSSGLFELKFKNNGAFIFKV